jgi:hypothetical protein
LRRPPTTISPADAVLYDYPATVTITAVPDVDILYSTNATGWAAPGTKYVGPFKIYQTTTFKAKAVYKGLKGFLPIESKVSKTTIRIIRRSGQLILSAPWRRWIGFELVERLQQPQGRIPV